MLEQGESDTLDAYKSRASGSALMHRQDCAHPKSSSASRFEGSDREGCSIEGGPRFAPRTSQHAGSSKDRNVDVIAGWTNGRF